MPEFEQRNDVETTTSSIRETSPQVSGPVKELFLENQTRNTPVQCLSGSKERPLEIQQNETHMTANNVGVDNILPPKKTTSQIQNRIVKPEFMNELFMPLSSTLVLKRKNDRLCPSRFQDWLNNRCPRWLSSLG